MDQDLIFKALADPTRRKLLDLLHTRDGRSLSQLEEQMPMTRFGVMKHLGLLKDAGLITTQKSGRETLHYLNALPIRTIYDRWVSKYTGGKASPLTDIEQPGQKKWQKPKLRRRPGKFIRSTSDQRRTGFGTR